METRTCQNCKVQFIIASDDFVFYKKIDVPPPTWCPECRRQKRLAFRNERRLFYRPCDFTGKMMLSIFRPTAPFPVYDPEVWFSDKWEPPEAEFDFSRPFFEQFRELQLRAPHMGRFVTQATLTNSDYVNAATDMKNCYMTFGANKCEEVYYCNDVDIAISCVDGLGIRQGELLYECVHCTRCYNLRFSQDCKDCTDSAFLVDCVGCSNCFMSANLRHKQYCIGNQQLTKSEYETALAKINLGNYQVLKKYLVDFDDLQLRMIHRFMQGTKNENATGDYLDTSKNAYECFDSFDLENCKYCTRIRGAKDSYDYDHWGFGNELTYEAIGSGFNSYSIKFCASSWMACRNLEYCQVCFSCEECFGCVGLKHAKFRILNKQYSEDEYRVLKAKIIEHMKKIGEYGQFFPPALCPFPYNDGLTAQFYPLTKEQVLARGFEWGEDDKKPQPATCAIPDDIKDVLDTLVKELLVCQECGKNYKIIQQELAFYRKVNVPIPRQCPDCRHMARLRSRTPRKIWHRQCMCNRAGHGWHTGTCPNEFETSYAPERKEIVYCERCYQTEVV